MRYTGPVIRNIIFDWSGTLVDDLPAVWKATNYVLAQAERPEMTLERIPRGVLPAVHELLRPPHAARAAAATGGLVSQPVSAQVQDSVCELPHAREFLEFCRARKLRTFLLSTVHRDHFAVQCRVTGFDAFLDKPYIGRLGQAEEDPRDPRRKPPARRTETLFIGDMQHDIETARHGGIHSCAVLTGYNTLEQLRAAKPDLIVEHLRRTARGAGTERPAPQTASQNGSRTAIRRWRPSAR